MSMPAQPLVLASAVADSTALTNSTTATTILPASGVCAIPGGALQVGSTIKITLRGRVSTVATTPGTLTFDVRLGAVVISALGAITLNATAQTSATWELELLATIRSIGTGTSATALVTGKFTSRALVGSGAVTASGNGVMLLPDTAPAVGTGFDSTLTNALQVFGTWSVASATNIITTHQAVVELKV
jgi:hypothetical protein